MRGRVLQRLFAVALAFSMLLSTMTPALADQGWPSGRDAVAPATVAPAPVVPAEQGPVAVPAELRAGPSSSAEESLPQAGASAVNPAFSARRIERVPAGTAVNLPGRFNRDFSVKPTGISVNTKMGPGVAALAAQGGERVGLVFHLDKPSLMEAGAEMTGEQRAAYAKEVAAYQEKVIAEVEANGGILYARFTTLSSGFIAFVPPQQIARLAGLPEVQRVAITNDYERDLSETVPMIGAQALQDLGFTGKGVNVAVLDSGIDYTHLAFGGPGTVEAYEAAYFGGPTDCPAFGDPTCANVQVANPALFGPAAPKVKGGWDWVGMSWPTYGVEKPDPNPIDAPDYAPFGGGHGTHVADIIGGLAFPGKGAGVAPDANLYAYTVCSSVSTSCSGIALLAGMDDAADLDNNPATYDPADVINMSLGSPYGQPEDDLTYFTNQAVKYGAIVVASAGNSADKPFIVGSPSIASGAVSVAQTTVPSATRYPIFYSSSAVSGTISTGVWQPWSVLPGNVKIEGPVAWGNADGSNKNGCAPYTDNMAGKVVLADRGVCSFSIKAENASNAGAVLSLIGLVAPGDPFEGGYGGGVINIPSFMILQSSATLLKNQIANGVVAGIDPAQAINLAYTIVGSSSRGPRNHDGAIKPDISAPGASVSAITGTGTEIGPFGGTSGAAPMVSGSMALLKGIYGDTLLPQQYKALAMNTGDAIYNGVPRTDMSPVTRQGGGQVNARSAYASKLIAWDSTDTADPLSWTGSISFGYVPATTYQAFTRTLTIQNLGWLAQGITIDSFFRSNEDLRQGVFVTPLVRTATIPAGGSIQVPVLLEVYPAGREAWSLDPLHPWVVNRGALGANGLALQYQEYDGYATITPQFGDTIHVVWQVLPKAAADTTAVAGPPLSYSVTLDNASPEVEGYSDVFDLMTQDANDYNYTIGVCASLGLPEGCNVTAIDIKEVGVRSYSDAAPNDFLEFAVTLWDKPFRAGQYPPEFDIYIDSDADGTDDYVIFNGDMTLNAADGRNVVFLVDLSEGVARPWYYIDSTFNSNNFILPMDADSIGVTPGQPFRFSVYAYDAYFTGELWDCAPKVGNTCTGAYQYTPGMARFQVAEADLFPTVPADQMLDVAYTHTDDGNQATPDQIGLLVLHRNAPVGRESDSVLLDLVEGLAAANSSPTKLGDTTQFTATITAGTNVTYAWDFGDGATGAGATPSHIYAAVGVYTATVTAANTSGSSTAETTATVRDVGIQGLAAANSSPTKLGDTTQFTATVTAGTNVTYAWDFGDGATGAGATPSHIYAAVGVYTATVTAANASGSSTAETTVTVRDVGIQGLAAANSSPTKLGDTTQFTATVTAGTNVTYAWDFGDGATGAGATPSHIYAAVGVYTATVTAANASGSSTAETTATVRDVGIQGLAAANSSPTKLGDTTQFTATVTAGTNVTYAWDFGDGATGAGATPSHIYAAVGVYTATVTAANASGSSTAETTVTVTYPYRVMLPVVMKNYNPSEWLDLTLLHTNDFHARVDEYDVGGAACDPTKATNCIGGYARLATLINGVRAKTPNVLLVDAGDQFQGTLYYNLFKSEVVAQMMNTVGYDAMTVGNHEFDDGPAELARLASAAKFPIVSTNLDVSTQVSLTGKLVPYTLVARGGHNVAVLGVTTPELPDISSPGPNVVVKDPATSVQATVDMLKGQGINKIVVLSHLGYEGDKALAAAVNGVDVIVGGHSHTFLYDPATAQTFTPPNLALTPAGPYPTVGGPIVTANGAGEPVLIVTAFEWGKFLGELDVTFDPAGVITAYDGNPIYVSNAVAKDAAIETMLAPYRAEVAKLMTLKVGSITVDAPISVGGKRICRLGECLMGNLVTDAMLWQVNTVGGGDYQIAVTNGGGLRAALLAGDVTYGGVMGVLPFGNTIATMGLKGADLLAALEHSVRSYPGENGGFLQVSGMRYIFDPGAAVGSRIVRADVWNGTAYEPILPDTVYKVVTNNFTRTGGDGYTWFRDNAINPYDGGPALHEAVIAYFQTFSPVTPMLEGRIGQPEVITILHTNDTHGRWEVDSYGGGMLRLAALIEQQRARNPNTILVDGGDTFQGNAFAYFFKDSADNPIAGGMELLKYDAMMLGNHEFNFGPTTFQTMIGQVDFPVLGSANLTDDGRYGLAAAGVQDYTKLTVGGKDVVIWGFTNPRVPRYELPSNIVGLTFEPFTTTFQADVPAILAAEKPDLFIALNHLGYEPYAGEDESDVLMAKGVAGIDVIIGSHSHTKLDPAVMVTSTVNAEGTLIAQTQAYASYLGVVDVGFVGDEIVYRRGRLIAANTVVTPSAALQTYLNPYIGQITTYNNTAIGKTSVPLDALKAYTEETNAANLQTDAAAWALAQKGHPVDFHLSGAMANRKVAGDATAGAPLDITKGDMFNLMPYENSLVVLELNGAQLKNILERGYRNYWYYKYQDNATPRWGGYSHYTTCMLDVSDGAVITYSDPGAGTPPNGSNVLSMTLNNNPIQFTANVTYTVSSVNYLVAGSCNFNDAGATLWPLDQITFDSQIYVRDSVTDYVATLPQPIAPAVEGRLVFQAP